MSMFSAVEMAPRDPILGLNEQFAAAESHRQEQELLAASRKRETEETEARAEDARKKLFTTGSELEKARSAAAFAEQRLGELASDLERISLERAERETFVEGAEAAQVSFPEFYDTLNRVIER